MVERIGTYARTTGETDLRVTVGLDGTGQATISTGNGMFDHLLHQDLPSFLQVLPSDHQDLLHPYLQKDQKKLRGHHHHQVRQDLLP